MPKISRLYVLHKNKSVICIKCELISYRARGIITIDIIIISIEAMIFKQNDLLYLMLHYDYIIQSKQR